MSSLLKKVINNCVPAVLLMVVLVWLAMPKALTLTSNQSTAANAEQFKFLIHYHTDPQMTQECGTLNECTNIYVGDCPQGTQLYELKEIIDCDAQ